MYLLFILHAGWQLAQPKGTIQFIDGVAATLAKQSGRGLRRLELTDAGFRDRG